MAKILLVEDDNNLREIYEARLQAEGYNIVSAHDGEEALVVAKSESPDLIISDVMMPKISGFEMLDILRNTDALKNVKIIMLTALGQDDDQQRANKLGADRYLVKSQVTLEDIVKTANELLKGESQSTDQQEQQLTSTSPTIASNPQPTTTTTNISVSSPSTTEQNMPPNIPVTEPPKDQPSPSMPPVAALDTAPAPTSVASYAPTTIGSDNNPASVNSKLENNQGLEAQTVSSEEAAIKSQIDNFADSKSNNQTMPTEPPVQNQSNDDSNSKAPSITPPVGGNKIIQPLSDMKPPDINELLAKENAIENMSNNINNGSIGPNTQLQQSSQPNSTIPGQNNQSSNSNNFDPNSIAL